MMVPSVPMVWISSGLGSCVLAFFWTESRISLSWLIASSSALMDFSRPTKRGTTMCGNTTISRSGSSGTARAPFLPFTLRESPGSLRWKNKVIAPFAAPPRSLVAHFAAPGGFVPRARQVASWADWGEGLPHREWVQAELASFS